jgi:hypothetical protein
VPGGDKQRKKKKSLGRSPLIENNYEYNQQYVEMGPHICCTNTRVNQHNEEEKKKKKKQKKTKKKPQPVGQLDNGERERGKKQQKYTMCEPNNPFARAVGMNFKIKSTVMVGMDGQCVDDSLRTVQKTHTTKQDTCSHIQTITEISCVIDTQNPYTRMSSTLTHKSPQFEGMVMHAY